MSVYNEEQGGFRPLRAPPTYPKSEENEIYTRSIYKQNKMCYQVRGALDRSHVCARSFDVRSTTKSCTFDCVLCI